MKRLFSLFPVAVVLCLLGGCSDLGPGSDTTQEEQFNRAVSVPGVPQSDSLGEPDQPAPVRVPGE